MKLTQKNSAMRPRSGILLLECMVYIAVFAILTGLGIATFYFCWDHTRATISAANNIEAAQLAGEGWRADIRAATGQISVATSAAGETVTIPERGKQIIYRFAAGELHREISAPADPQNRLLFPKVKMSGMKMEMRAGVTAWRWELELPSPPKIFMPLRFTFEAVAKNAS